MTFKIRINSSTPLWYSGYQRADTGYTLVELTVVVAIIAVLAAMAIPAYSGYIEIARIKRCIAEIRTLEKEISLYQQENYHLPDSLGDIKRDTLMDPWGHPYMYLNIADGGVKGKGKLRRDRNINPLNSDYDLYSMGADGDTKTNLNTKEGQDDIVRASDGAFVGIGSDF